MTPQRTGECHESDGVGEHSRIFAPMSARDGKRHPDITRSDGRPPALQVAHPKLSEQQPSQYFLGSQQARRHKAKGELQWGGQRKETQEELK